ncbi:endonuclease/exonuclease/phosphatase family protein [Streptomyces sp. NBC_00151]|uniref:endonuclease/exonuclease/phosphatase family protein n=1 Tax=Streptomyces sp. NBC_00151 TaxID=2975669 RepID=UPI002DD9B9C7|nr:endonuclease/exonuclease/phosphatase family protein [Streptomyces sp. NBC_00151]WRZ43375.1 endonuclease/exonuclease/phosphatase family protein [Streptomyces sp. NBC_00151]
MPDSSRVTRRAGIRNAVAAAVALPLLTTARASATRRPRPRPRLDVMTYNLRFASAVEPNSWAVRRPVMRELLRRTRPHVIGTQEGLYQQLLDIEADLAPRYEWIGTGREGGSGDESVALFYDTRRLAPLEHDTFWLSDTPQVIGSNTWGAALPRIATWVRFRDLADGGRQFHVLNTHLDHASQYARARAAALVAERIAEFDPSLPCLVTGDFNAPAHRNEVYDILLGAGLTDTWDTAAARSRLYATFHGYAPLTPDGDRIDWILAGPGVEVRRASIDTFSLHGQFPSDHLPVRASLTLG